MESGWLEIRILDNPPMIPRVSRTIFHLNALASGAIEATAAVRSIGSLPRALERFQSSICIRRFISERGDFRFQQRSFRSAHSISARKSRWQQILLTNLCKSLQIALQAYRDLTSLGMRFQNDKFAQRNPSSEFACPLLPIVRRMR